MTQYGESYIQVTHVPTLPAGPAGVSLNALSIADSCCWPVSARWCMLLRTTGAVAPGSESGS